MNKHNSTVQMQNETFKVDGKNWTIESSGLITWIVVIGFIVLSGAYIYGKFFHVKVATKIRSSNEKRRARKKTKKK